MKGVEMMGNDKKNAQELTERYLYAVTKRLPAAQRADIEKELRGLIEDMLADRTADAEATPKDVESVLLELGKPAELAAKYRGSKDYLIGPDYFALYIMVLKIVLAGVSGGLTIALLVGFIAGERANIFGSIGNYFSSLISALFQAFGWVTVIFAIMQKYNAKIDEENKTWNPKELPEVPEKKARINKSEPIAGIVFTVLALLLLNTVPGIIGVFWLGEAQAHIPVFDMTVFTRMLPLINVVFALSILKEVIRLVIEKYNLKLAAAVTVINAVSLMIVLYVFSSPAIWNAEFITQLQAIKGFEMPADFDLAYHWSRVPLYFSGIVSFSYILDTLTSIFKAARFHIVKTR